MTATLRPSCNGEKPYAGGARVFFVTFNNIGYLDASSFSIHKYDPNSLKSNNL